MSRSKGTALVTGASAGLGAEFARQLAARGNDLLLVARREDRLKDLASEIAAKHGRRAFVFAADLSDPDAPERIQAFADAEGLRIDWLVNNAGIAGPELLPERDWHAQARFFELMMISVAHMCHLFVPGMQERGFGRVINVSSFAGRISRPAGANYGPAKAYLVALSEELALILKDTGVHVCALCPGFTHTEFHEAAGLMEMKRGLPGFIWYDADVVVREGIEAVESGKPIWISGRLYRWLDPLAQSVWVRPILKAIAPGR
ncbi:MAG TPA: SDR family oxidoreductase [Myxococcota bacterium]|nr:SDR family oxidoreductase [Myxococcota bacterium]